MIWERYYNKGMELNGILQVIIGAVASLGGFSLIKFLFFMKPERRKAQAEAEIKELEAEEKEMSVMRTLVESLKQRIEQQDEKIRELNQRVDKLYEEKHELERLNNQLTRENAMLQIKLVEAQHNLCVRPDDECLKRMPPRDYCRLVKLANHEYDKYYQNTDENENSGVSEKPDKSEQP